MEGLMAWNGYLKKNFQIPKPSAPGTRGQECFGQGAKKFKKAVADYIRSIFYASSKKSYGVFSRV